MISLAVPCRGAAQLALQLSYHVLNACIIHPHTHYRTSPFKQNYELSAAAYVFTSVKPFITEDSSHATTTASCINDTTFTVSKQM